MPTPIPATEYPTLIELANITYQDRIERIGAAQLQDDGDTIIAIGQDGIKRIAFRVTSEQIEFKLLNPEDIIGGDESEDDEPKEDAATFMLPAKPGEDLNSLSDSLIAPPDPVRDVTTTLRPQASNLITDWLQAIKDTITSSGDLNEIGDRLMALYPDLPSGDLARLLADASTVAGLAGYYEAQEATP
jgi:hypothetical protein